MPANLSVQSRKLPPKANDSQYSQTCNGTYCNCGCVEWICAKGAVTEACKYGTYINAPLYCVEACIWKCKANENRKVGAIIGYCTACMKVLLKENIIIHAGHPGTRPYLDLPQGVGPKGKPYPYASEIPKVLVVKESKLLFLISLIADDIITNDTKVLTSQQIARYGGLGVYGPDICGGSSIPARFIDLL